MSEGFAAATETAFIQQARQNNPASWEQIISRYQEPVFRLAYLLLGDSAEADDVAQETFIRAYRSLSTFDTTRPLRPWLMQITANLARNRHRSLGRYWQVLRRFWQSQLNEDETDALQMSIGQQQAQIWSVVLSMPERRIRWPRTATPVQDSPSSRWERG